MQSNKLLNNEFRKILTDDKEVIAGLIFGSYTRTQHYRDIDICIVLDRKYPNLYMSRKKLKYSSLVSSKFDIGIFQQLPLYIRKRVLKDGKIFLCKDEDLLYEIAFSTIKEFEYYKRAYYSYLGTMTNEKNIR